MCWLKVAFGIFCLGKTCSGIFCLGKTCVAVCFDWWHDFTNTMLHQQNFSGRRSQKKKKKKITCTPFIVNFYAVYQTWVTFQQKIVKVISDDTENKQFHGNVGQNHIYIYVCISF